MLRTQPEHIHMHSSALVEELVIVWMVYTLEEWRFSSGDMVAAEVCWFSVRL